jgi:hypothetical protein
MNSYITIFILTYLIFLSACKPRECEIPDAPPFTEDQLSWIDSSSYNYKLTSQGSGGMLLVDTVRSYHTSHMAPVQGWWGTGIRCEEAIKMYTGKTQWNLYSKWGWGIASSINIESRDHFTVYPGTGNEYLTYDPRTDTATILGLLYSNVYKYQDTIRKFYISKAKGVIYVEYLKYGHPKVEILP